MSRKTPLAIALSDDEPSSRPTPVTAFHQARKWWLQGRRLNLSALAEELGIGRATLMRWVGNKELLLGEILWSLYSQVLSNARERADAVPGLEGVEYLARIYEEVNGEIMSADALHQFLRHDPQFALRVLTSNVSGLQGRLVDAWRTLLDEQVARGAIEPQMDTEDLAFFVVRIGEGAIYSDIICGREPAREPATKAFRLLLSSPRP